MRVAVVGLGRIGLPMAAHCAVCGHEVVAVDRDPNVRACIEFADLAYEEPGLEAVLGRLQVVSEVDEADAAVWIVAVGTNWRGRLSAKPVEDVVARIAQRGAQLVIIESTVEPGTCARLAERYDLAIAHCPERARPGQVFKDIATIPRLIGGVDEAATVAALDFYDTLTDAPLRACTAAEAELAKLAENAEREVRIAFANELADVANMLDLDPARVIELANSHPRAAILQPGVGVGGLCLPMATGWFAQRSTGVCAAARALHERRPAEIAERITANLAPGAKVCILGRTYRPNTRYHQPGDDSDPYNSPAVALIAALRNLGFEVTSWDPSDEDGTREEAMAGADLVYVAVRHGEGGRN